MEYFYSSQNLRTRNLAPGVTIKTMWGENIMMSLVEMDANSEVPLHSHPNEQAGMVLEGSFEFTIGEQKKVVSAGEYYIIPGGVEHQVIVGDSAAKALDIFSPPREDYK
ncbi:MAG: cupin domain-containing protein [Chloroflexota bacterium]|jgi:quercetin dioxygenase-like cupin family protein|nr:cupin domain-containing protein [Chloroflexota bacterium]|tara:strand:+ start:479 stop:805 length:327 start_codon:yes stop_codon:yes gene_type:complete